MKKWDVKDINKWGWKEHPTGGIIPEAGTAYNYKTGGWRSHRPIKDDEKCNDCLICYMFCPDAAIGADGGKIGNINLDHCKGCGICAKECPKKAIEMIDETKAKTGEDERSEECNA